MENIIDPSNGEYYRSLKWIMLYIAQMEVIMLKWRMLYDAQMDPHY
jgi:hypothetical protein